MGDMNLNLIRASNNPFSALQSLSLGDKFVLKADGSGFKKMSKWQSFKDYFRTRGAVKTNQTTIAGLKRLITEKFEEQKVKGLLKGLDNLSRCGVALTGRQIRQLFAHANFGANAEDLKRAVANNLAQIMRLPEKAGKTYAQLLKSSLEDAKFHASTYKMDESTFEKGLKACVERRMVLNLRDCTQDDGTLKADGQLKSLEKCLLEVLNDFVNNVKSEEEARAFFVPEKDNDGILKMAKQMAHFG